MTLQANGDGFTVTVSDDGRGFDLTAPSRKGNSRFGLRSVNERLQLFGGHSDIDSQPGLGTQVALFLPHRQSTAAHAIEG